VVDKVNPSSDRVDVVAVEADGTTENWTLSATAICAKAP
jgi:hypothetical protein